MELIRSWQTICMSDARQECHKIPKHDQRDVNITQGNFRLQWSSGNSRYSKQRLSLQGNDEAGLSLRLRLHFYSLTLLSQTLERPRLLRMSIRRARAFNERSLGEEELFSVVLRTQGRHCDSKTSCYTTPRACAVGRELPPRIAQVGKFKSLQDKCREQDAKVTESRTTGDDCEGSAEQHEMRSPRSLARCQEERPNPCLKSSYALTVEPNATHLGTYVLGIS